MQLPEGKKYTYSDYLTWDDDERYELIDGVPHMMSAPSVNHQEIVANLIAELVMYLKGKPCKAFPAPFDVRLNADKEDDSVVQPDISVICDQKKIEDGKSCKGAPDMIVEILSPSTAIHDQNIKFNKYREAGVREYWIVYPELRSVQVNLLLDGKYVNQGYFIESDTIVVNVLEDFPINLADIFPPLPTETAGRTESTAD